MEGNRISFRKTSELELVACISLTVRLYFSSIKPQLDLSILNIL